MISVPDLSASNTGGLSLEKTATSASAKCVGAHNLKAADLLVRDITHEMAVTESIEPRPGRSNVNRKRRQWRPIEFGAVFGRLTVMSAEANAEGPKLYRCVCQCGGSKSVTGVALNEGSVRSCGCLKRELRTPAASLFRQMHAQAYSHRLPVHKEWHQLDTFMAWARAQMPSHTSRYEFRFKNKLRGFSPDNCWLSVAAETAEPPIAAGQRFGNLTVRSQVPESPDDGVLWKCDCDCGRTREVGARRLNSGMVYSCGLCPSRKPKTA